MKTPEPLTKIETRTLKLLCQEYIYALDSGTNVDRRTKLEGYIFEMAMETVFGGDVWNWINKKIEEAECE